MKRWIKITAIAAACLIVVVVALDYWISYISNPCTGVADVGPYKFNALDPSLNTLQFSRPEVLKRLQKWRIPYRIDGDQILLPECGTTAWGMHIW